ncbi:MAG: hypothetical protein WCX17_00915 [Parcubacteria group bacterium]|jgi:hypothetical protein
MNNILDVFSQFIPIFQALSQFWWIILPVLLYFMFEQLWMDFVIEFSKDAFFAKLQWTYLEIIPPKDIEKGPKGFESLYQGIAGVVVTIVPLDKYLNGTLMDRFSFEIVGEEGVMHFYVRTQKKFRNLIEAQLYAQFPGTEIVEVEDYTQKFPKTVPNKDWDLWGADIMFAEPDELPIKTYDKFEEDITGTMIDPLAAMAEVIGTLGPGQHIWLQYVLDPQPELWKKDEAHRKIIDQLAKKTEKKEMNFFDHLIDVFSNLFKALSGPVEFASAEKNEDQPLEFKLTPGEKEALKATEENFMHNFFRVKMRLIILGRREVFDKTFITAFFGTIKQFSDLNLNSFKPEDASKTYAYYWMHKERLVYRQRKIYRRYRDRDMTGKTIYMSSKELATVWHFPNMEVQAPSLTQVQAKRGSAPANLPVGE